MSFASDCKDEASTIKDMPGHCKMASLEAMLRLNSEIVRTNGHFIITFLSANSHVAVYFKSTVFRHPLSLLFSLK